MEQPDVRSGVAAPHHVRMWRWVVFDPPMRDHTARGCRMREVSCAACNCALGTIDDPLEGFLLAWRHRRTTR
ncbi:MAG TPA: hypothetical protein VMV22_02205 [Acidimicrobiales bacterium]|nr:hypothetical protein [Acidimicrobiales bacterium]